MVAPTCGYRGRYRIALTAISITALFGIAPCRAGGLYGFADEQGVFNFSDAPSDPRHRLIMEVGSTRRAEPRQRATTFSAVTTRRTPASLAPHINAAARHSGIDPSLIEAVALVESGLDERARSPKGAVGLMQLMPATAARFGVSNPLDPRQNLFGGARYLRELLDRFDSLPLALAAYNAGEGAVERYGNTIPPFDETVAYVPRVLSRYAQLRHGPGIPAAENSPSTAYPQSRTPCC